MSKPAGPRPGVEALYQGLEGGTAWRRLLGYAAAVFVPLALIGALVLVAYHQWDWDNDLELLELRETLQVTSGAQTISHHLVAPASDLRVLAHLPVLLDPPPAWTARNLAAITDYFLSFSQAKGIYDQVRLIDADGQERVRINLGAHGAYVVPAGELQNKADRPYFAQTRALKPGQIYLSRLDLNIERGRPEQPYKPVIRLATPLYDHQGRLRGILALNYLAGPLLEDFSAAITGDPGAMLLDAQGYWLHGPRPELEWGFMFSGGSSFARQHPQAWAHIRAADRGQLQTAEGLYTHTRVHPLAAMQGPDGAVPAATVAAYHWYVVSHIPLARLQAMQFNKRIPLERIYVGYLALIAIVSLLLGRGYLANRRARDTLSLAIKLMESSSDGIVITDMRSRILYVNRAFSAITGYDFDEVLGRTPKILSSGLQDKAFYTAMWEHIQHDGHWEGEIWNRNKAGIVYAEWLRVSALRDAEDNVTHYVGMFSDITTRKHAEHRLIKLALRDPLTGLYNRAAFEDALQRALDGARRRGTKCALVYVDLDRFKPINDLHGHKAGDTVLCEIAARLTHHVRSTDTAARLGGDEFALILADIATAAEAETVAAKLVAALAAPITIQGLTLQVGASAGIALFPDDTEDGAGLVKYADEAMYVAKQAGGNTHVMYRTHT